MFRFAPQRYSNDGWFRVGSVDVTTTILVLGVSVLSLFLTAISQATFFDPYSLNGHQVRSGQVWRIATWPFANFPNIWFILSAFIFFMLGTQLEGDVGRKRFAWMLAILTVVPGIVGVLYPVGWGISGASLHTGAEAFGLSNLTTGLLVIFALRFPFARSLLNIPLWVLLAVFETIYALQIIAERDWAMLVFFLASLAVAALIARAFDLTEFHQIPKLPLPGFVSGDPYAKTNRSRARKNKQQAGSSTSRGNSTGRPTGKGRSPGSPFARSTPAEVIPLRPEPRLSREAQAELDTLLDKISEGGMDSLTVDERARLDELSRTLRGE
ncbi:MAG TPA: rhomboid family intramembrane serine protease [Microthrixaceae bacterium]|nr:rhomboid family intramembrane serine protease [Microthrixaceae bacterium]HPB46549.1 rhomboid family intramembrane serine protease [Microthrixaceae bacterium]